MLMPAREFNDLRHFRFGHLEGEDPADTHAVSVDMQHDLHGLVAILVEEALEDEDDELHGRVVVVEEKNLVEARFLGFRPRFCRGAAYGAGPGTVSNTTFIVLLVAHRPRGFRHACRFDTNSLAEFRPILATRHCRMPNCDGA